MIYSEEVNYDGVIVRNVDGYPGYYISRNGRFKGPNGWLKSTLATTGYFVCTVRNLNGKRQTQKLIHRLVATAWITNPYPGAYTMINHIDGVRSNCDANNLEWTNSRGNNLSRTEHRTGCTSSRYPGVTWDKSTGKWLTATWMGAKLKHIGRYKNEEDAAQAYVQFLTNHGMLLGRA